MGVHVLLLGGEDHNLRMPFMRALSAQGCKITIAASGDAVRSTAPDLISTTSASIAFSTLSQTCGQGMACKVFCARWTRTSRTASTPRLAFSCHSPRRPILGRQSCARSMAEAGPSRRDRPPRWCCAPPISRYNAMPRGSRTRQSSNIAAIKPSSSERA